MSDMKELMQEASQVLSKEMIDGLVGAMASSPKLMAEMFWQMDDEQMAEFFHELFQVTEGSHKLMMQMLHTKEACEGRSPEALECFQTMFASAFTSMWSE